MQCVLVQIFHGDFLVVRHLRLVNLVLFEVQIGLAQDIPNKPNFGAMHCWKEYFHYIIDQHYPKTPKPLMFEWKVDSKLIIHTFEYPVRWLVRSVLAPLAAPCGTTPSCSHMCSCSAMARFRHLMHHSLS